MIYQILTLFRDACLEHDIPAAQAHSKALPQSLELLPPATSTQLAVQIMCNDADYAVEPLRRTVVNIDDWIPGGFQALADTYEVHLPHVPPVVYEGVHLCVQDPITVTSMIRVRRCLAMADAGIVIDSASKISLADTIYSWVAIVTTYDMGQLCNLILDLTEASPDSKIGLQSTLIAETNTFNDPFRVSLALGTLYSIRIHIHRAPMSGVDIRDAAHHLMPLLEKYLKQSLVASNPEDLVKYDDAYLWMYYIGAHHEERVRLKLAQPSTPPLIGWFSGALRSHAKSMIIKTRDAARQVLEHFVHSAFLDPGLDTGWLDLLISDIDEQRQEGDLCYRSINP